MKVAIIGDVTHPLDEGMKKTTYALSVALGKHCELQVFNPLRAAQMEFWRSLLAFKPQIVHYVPGPSLKSFILLKIIKTLVKASTVVSITHPDPNLPVKLVNAFLKPDLVLLQSHHSQTQFLPLNVKKEFIPNGVDTQRFKRVDMITKSLLRQKYHIPSDSFVVLHVGNTRQIRNLEQLIEVQKNGFQVVVVSSTTIKGDQTVAENLRAAGCIVLDYFIEGVEEVYQLADCYVFPTINNVAAIEFPLSVLEAMACGLPVIASRFGALPDYFTNEDEIYFLEKNETILSAVIKAKSSLRQDSNKNHFDRFDWSQVADHIFTLYQSISSNTNLEMKNSSLRQAQIDK